MALDNLESIREYRDQVRDKVTEGITAIALGPLTMLRLLNFLLEEIDQLQAVVDTGKDNQLESVTTVPLHQKRRVKPDTRLTGPDLISSD